MAQLHTKVKMFLENNSKTWESEEGNILLQDDGEGGYIKRWDVSGLEKPTDLQLSSLESDANDYDAKELIRINRQRNYPSITDVTIALAEKAEGNSQMWDTITAQRLDVKSKYPKSS